MTVSRVPSAQSFRLDVGPLDNPTPVNVRVVQGSPEGLEADANLTMSLRERDCESTPISPDAKIVDDRPNYYVTVTKRKNNHYHGLYVRRQLAAKTYHPMDRLHLRPLGTEEQKEAFSLPYGLEYGSKVIIETVVAAQGDGASSVVIDCDRSFDMDAWPSQDIHDCMPEDVFTIFDKWVRHKLVSTMFLGIQEYVENINEGRIPSGISDIALVMGPETFAVWEEGSRVFVRCFKQVDLDVRSLVDDASQVWSTMETLKEFIHHAEMVEQMWSSDVNKRETIASTLSMVRQEFDSLVTQLGEIKEVLRRSGHRSEKSYAWLNRARP